MAIRSLEIACRQQFSKVSKQSVECYRIVDSQDILPTLILDPIGFATAFAVQLSSSQTAGFDGSPESKLHAWSGYGADLRRTVSATPRLRFAIKSLYR
jgi:hypothetical protein